MIGPFHLLFIGMVAIWNIQFYDQFGFETDAIYTGGSVVVLCHVTSSVYDGGIVELIDPQWRKAAHATMIETDENESGTWWRLKIQQGISLGIYRCRYKGDTSSSDSKNGTKEVLATHYRICHNREPVCSDDETCTDEKKFCVFDSDKHRSCFAASDTQESICAVHEPWGFIRRVCPANHRTLCSAIAGGQYANSWSSFSDNFLVNHYPDRNGTGRFCPAAEDDVPQLYYANERRLLDDTFELVPEHKTVSIKHGPIFYGKNWTCTIRNQDSEHVDAIITEAKTPWTNLSFNYDRLFQNGSQVYKIRCEIFEASAGLTHDRVKVYVSNVFVLFGSKPSIQMTNSNLIICKFEPELPRNVFVAKYWWTSTKMGNSIIGNDSTIEATDRGAVYECHVELTYKTCSPYRKFRMNATAKQPIAIVTMAPDDGKTKPKPDGISVTPSTTAMTKPNIAYTAMIVALIVSITD